MLPKLYNGIRAQGRALDVCGLSKSAHPDGEPSAASGPAQKFIYTTGQEPVKLVNPQSILDLVPIGDISYLEGANILRETSPTQRAAASLLPWYVGLAMACIYLPTFNCGQPADPHDQNIRLTAMSAGDVYVRDVRESDELEVLSDLFLRAFLSDTVWTYVLGCKMPLADSSQGNKQDDLRAFFRWLVKMTLLIKSLVKVAVLRGENGAETLVAACIWNPPNKRVDLWRLFDLVKSGFFGVLRRFGFRGLLRLGFEYSDAAEACAKEGLKSHGLKPSPRKAWLLLLAATHPDHQGKGHMGVLLREQLAREPRAIHILEASSAKSMGLYKHIGWEIVKEFRVGTGKVTEKGLPPAEGEASAGVPVWSMIKCVESV